MVEDATRKGTSISLVVTVKNEAASIATLLESIKAQTLPPEEIVLIEAGSTDGSPAIIEGFKTALPQLRVTVARGMNISQGRNLGILAGRNEIIAVTDAGCRLAVNWLEEITKPLVENPRAACVVGSVIPDPRTGFERCAGICSLSHTEGRTMSVPKGSARSLAFRKSAWEAVGEFPDWLPIGEDSLFIQHLEIRGFELVLRPGAVVYWRPRSSYRGIVVQFFRYAQAAARTGMVRRIYHKTLWKYLLLAALVVIGWVSRSIWILPIPGVFVLLHFLRKMRRLGSRIKPLDLWRIPAISIAVQVGVLAGLVTGLLERWFNPFWREQVEKRRAE